MIMIIRWDSDLYNAVNRKYFQKPSLSLEEEDDFRIHDLEDDVSEVENSRSKRRSLNPRWLSRQMGLRKQDQAKRMNLQANTYIPLK